MANYDFFLNEDEYGETRGYKVGRALGSALGKIFGKKTSFIEKDRQAKRNEKLPGEEEIDLLGEGYDVKDIVKKYNQDEAPSIPGTNIPGMPPIDTSASAESTNVNIQGVPFEHQMQNYQHMPPVDATGPQDVDYTGGEAEATEEGAGGYDSGLDIPGPVSTQPEVDYTGPQDIDYTGQNALSNIPETMPSFKKDFVNAQTKSLIGEGLYNTLFGDSDNLEVYEPPQPEEGEEQPQE